MVHLGDVPQNLMKILSTAVSTVLLIALFFILQYLFDLDFVCSCRPGVHLIDVTFLAVPPLILTVIVTLMEPFYQKWIFSRRCNYCCNNFCSFIGMFLMKYLYLSAVWVSTVLFDGDWYICLQTNLNTNQTGMPCKKNLTYEETLIRTDYKNASLDWGFAVISGFFLLWNAFNCFQASFSRCKMWKRSSVSKQYLCCPPYYRWVYEDLLSEEVSCYLKEELRKIAKERAKELCKEHVMTIRNHELPKQRQNPGGSNVTNPNENPDDNPNGNSNDNPIGNANENPNGNGNGNPNDNPNGNANEIPNGNGNDNPNGNANGNGNPNDNPNGNGNNEKDNIFETWQKISHSYFYLMDEGLL